MSIKATINTSHDGITIKMIGGLSYENGAPLRQKLQELRDSHPNLLITIDFAEVDFVGSSGIGPFVETIKALNRFEKKVRLANVKSEFLKVFKLYNFYEMEALLEEFEKNDAPLDIRFSKKTTFDN